MRHLVPEHRDLTTEDFPDVYETGRDDAWFVRLNFVTTVDGSAVGADGRSGSINNDVDGDVFQMLRAWADVIVVGSATAQAEGYEAPETDEKWTHLRQGRAEHPAMAVLTRSGQLPDGFVTNGREDVFALDTSGDDGLQRAFHALRRRGYKRVLLEGGPTVTSLALQANLVDEVCLTTSPKLVGGATHRMVNGPALDSSAKLVSLVEDDSTLLARWSLR